MKERLKQPFDGHEQAVPDGRQEAAAPDQRICVYCRQRIGEACFTCAAEGKYRWLDPELLSHWETVPELPPLRDLVELPASARLAFVYLALYYLIREKTRE